MGLKILPQKMTAQIVLVSEIRRFFKKNFKEIMWKKLIILNCKVWGGVKVLSGVANPASKYDCSMPFSFRDMTVYMICSKIFKEF